MVGGGAALRASQRYTSSISRATQSQAKSRAIHSRPLSPIASTPPAATPSHVPRPREGDPIFDPPAKTLALKPAPQRAFGRDHRCSCSEVSVQQHRIHVEAIVGASELFRCLDEKG